MRLRFDVTVAATVVLVAVIASTSADRQLCITADNFISGLYMAGDTNTNYVNQMHYASKVHHFDCVQMPSNPTVIAVEASNFDGKAGILSYETGVGAPYKDWKCAAAADVTDPNWMATNFDDSKWATAKHFVLKTNGDLAFVHQAKKHHAYSWVWTSKMHDKFKHVYCRLRLCDDNCKSCTIAGPGYCDPGMCTTGSVQDPTTGLNRCNH